MAQTIQVKNYIDLHSGKHNFGFKVKKYEVDCNNFTFSGRELGEHGIEKGSSDMAYIRIISDDVIYDNVRDLGNPTIRPT